MFHLLPFGFGYLFAGTVGYAIGRNGLKGGVELVSGACRAVGQVVCAVVDSVRIKPHKIYAEPPAGRDRAAPARAA